MILARSFESNQSIILYP